jgi:hypothetical protein
MPPTATPEKRYANLRLASTLNRTPVRYAKLRQRPLRTMGTGKARASK